MKGGVHRNRGPNHWQESRDSHLTQPSSCPTHGVHLKGHSHVPSLATHWWLKVALSSPSALACRKRPPSLSRSCPSVPRSPCARTGASSSIVPVAASLMPAPGTSTMQQSPAVSTVTWTVEKYRWLLPCSVKRPIPGIDIIGSENISGG